MPVYKTLIATNRNSRWVFVYGFAKNERSNVDKDEAKALNALAAYLMGLSQAALEKACNSGSELQCVKPDLPFLMPFMRPQAGSMIPAS